MNQIGIGTRLVFIRENPEWNDYFLFGKCYQVVSIYENVAFAVESEQGTAHYFSFDAADTPWSKYWRLYDENQEITVDLTL